MSGNRQALGWGVALLLVGATWLLRNLGLLPDGVGLVPVLLIAAGMALLVGGVSRSGQPPAPTGASLALDGAASARLELGYGAGTLRLAGGAEPGLLYQGTFAGGVRQDASRRGDRVEATLRHASNAPQILGWARPLDWDLRVADRVPIDLEVRTGASRVRLDLAGLQVRSLKIETGASDVDVVLPAHGRCRVEIEAGAADVRVRVPEGVAASVRTSSALASVNVDPTRFPRIDGTHRSPDYETAAARADIEIDGGLASFSVV
jgi:hypothetical protein